MSEEIPQVKFEAIPATRRVVSRLYFAGLIDRGVRERALEILYPERLWKLWTSRLLLVLGAVLTLTGIIFFFAANWDRLTDFMKFGMIEAGLVLCLVGTWHYGLDRLSGRILLLSAGVLVGVFLAVFGQVYQTGADSWTIFTGWSALILGWVLVARFVPLWWVWLVVTNVALGSFLGQTGLWDFHEMTIFIPFTLLNGTVLAVREFARARGVSWLQEPWSRLVLTLGVLVTLLIPVSAAIFDYDEGMMPGFLLGIAGGGFLYWFFRFRLRDMWCFSGVVLFWSILMENAFIRLFDRSMDEAAVLLLCALFTIGLFALACWHVMKVLKKKEADDA
ncbi:MAG: DUF2157 domain-containing protein [Opitutales bacterium]|nr:DUF2157 domain-containing protein [Opitutales bacterium]